MSFCVDLVSEDSFYENITLGVTKLLGRFRPVVLGNFLGGICTAADYLKWGQREYIIYTATHGFKNQLLIESDPRICNVSVERRSPCDRVAITTWEQRHSAILPDDLRNFYASSDGFQLTWHYKYSADEILPVGSIHVNSLNELYLSPALKDLLDFSITRQGSSPRPVLNTKSKVFELDSCRTIGKVCLIYTGGSWSVWLVTREGSWGWLSDSFTMYFRMALVHLGLPGWQAAFANLPLIPWAEQLFLLLAPHLLEKVDSENNGGVVMVSEAGLNHIDPNIFKTSVRHHKGSRQNNQS